jgi:hypothetical protein
MLMLRYLFSSRFSLVLGGLLALGTAACGTKPDGTPYGVDPAKLPAGRLKTQRAAAAAAATMYRTDMPKGAEMNAVTSGAKVGQPTALLPPATSAR